MAEVSAVINSSVASVSGAMNLDQILASSAPYNYSDYNWKITTFEFPTITSAMPFPNSGTAFQAPASSYNIIVDDESVKGSIHNIINTKKYERVMEPDLGVSLSRAVFELFDEDAVDFVQFELVKAFNRYDDRLSVNKVQVVKRDDGQTIQINCEVAIRGIDKSIPVVFRNRKGAF